MHIDSLCLDCAEPVQLRMRDDVILAMSPEMVVGHANLPAPEWKNNWAHT